MMLSKIYLVMFFVTAFLAIMIFVNAVLKSKKIKIQATKTTVVKKKNFKFILLCLCVFFAVALLSNIIIAMTVISVFLYIYVLLVQRRKNNYRNLINKQLLEAVRLFKNAVISGQSAVQAFESVAKQTAEPLSSEFKKICSDVNFGINIDKAIESSIERISDGQYRLFLDSVRISSSTGASLSNILEKIEDAVAQKTAIYLKLNALTAQAKISGMVISVVPVIIVLFVLMSEPEMMSPLFTDILGNIVLFVSVLMILAGSFLMRKISEVDI